MSRGGRPACCRLDLPISGTQTLFLYKLIRFLLLLSGIKECHLLLQWYEFKGQFLLLRLSSLSQALVYKKSRLGTFYLARLVEVLPRSTIGISQHSR